MPKKGKAGSLFGRKSASAKINAKNREDEDYAAKEREKQRELMALRRQHSDEREKQRVYDQEKRNNKKFRAREREKDKEAHRESRDSMLARKQAEEEQRDAQIREEQAKSFYRNYMKIRSTLFDAWRKHLGFDEQKFKEDKGDYILKWQEDMKAKDLIEWLRYNCEQIWGRQCFEYLQHSPSSSCIWCKAMVDTIAEALYHRDILLSLSDEWSNKALEVIEEGPRCIICMHIPVPMGIRYPKVPPCERCEIGREVRAKLIDFWNHRQAQMGVTTIFSIHKDFECVCEKEAVLKPIVEFSEESSQEEEEEETSEEEEEEEVHDH